MAANHGPVTVNDKLVREHAEGWESFTRFTTVSIICVTLILLMFMLHFAVGWGYAVFFMLIGWVATAILALLGKI